MSSNEQDAGLLAYEQGDFAAALAEWRQLAEEGNLQACHNIAIMYEMGQGVEADLAQAQQWCERAAQGGSVPAQAHFGLFADSAATAGTGGTMVGKSRTSGRCRRAVQLGSALLFRPRRGEGRRRSRRLV